jgi:hypothetical protein
MRRAFTWTLVFLVAAVAFTLAGCQPISYYLKQVDKAYGKVTDAATGQPIESVEVVLGNYQYSELTNGLGDYEIELADGAWTLHFVKDGYVTVDRTVTVSSSKQRVQVDVPLTPTAPPAPWIAGAWANDDYYYYLPSTHLYVISGSASSLTWVEFDNFDGTGTPVNTYSGSLAGNVLVVGPMTLAITQAGNDTWSFDMDATRTMYFYRKGTQRGVSVFAYAASTSLSAGVQALGEIPAPPSPPPSRMHVHQVVLYTFTALSAGTYTVQLQDHRNSSFSATASVFGYKADQKTKLFEVSSTDTPPSVSLGSGEMIYLVVEAPYYDPGETFGILVQ